MNNALYAIFIALVSSFLYDTIKSLVNYLKNKPVKIKKIRLSLDGLVIFAGISSITIIAIITVLLFLVPEKYHWLLIVVAIGTTVSHSCFSSLLKRFCNIKHHIRHQACDYDNYDL